MGENVSVLGARFRAIECIVCLIALTWACGPRSTPVPATPTQESTPSAPAVTRPEASSPDCALITEPGESIATVALADRIDPSNAPHPSNEGERLLFRQVYETLIRIDCHGHVRPGLAASWRLAGDGRTWIITLRENARFSDGTPVTPNDVLASWTRDATGNGLRPPVSRLVHSIVPTDDRTVAIALRSQRVDAPLALAHTDLAIAKPAADSPWPLGTRTDGAAPEPDAPGIAARSVITIRGDTLSPIRFVPGAGDPRDLLDKQVDLLLTRDAAALEYAATLPHFQSVPLEWQRIHVLLTPGRMSASPSPSADARQALATDAVRGESRGAVGPFWWQMLPDCEVADPQPRNQSTTTTRIVYDQRDAAARDLAERLVGLARDSGREPTGLLERLLPHRPRQTYQRAVGLTGEALARARRLGTDAGYIVPLERRPLDACRDIQVVMESAPWLDPETIVPLVETRLRAVVRRGRSGVNAEWDGGLVLAGARGPG